MQPMPPEWTHHIRKMPINFGETVRHSSDYCSGFYPEFAPTATSKDPLRKNGLDTNPLQWHLPAHDIGHRIRGDMVAVPTGETGK